MAIASLPHRAVAMGKAKAVTSTSIRDTKLDNQLASLYATLSHSADLNPLIDLTDILRQNLVDDLNVSHLIPLRKGIQFVVRSLQALLQQGRIPLAQVDPWGRLLSSSSAQSGKAGQASTAGQDQVTVWLQQRWNGIATLLCQLLNCQDAATRTLALDSLLLLQADASVALTKEIAEAEGAGQSESYMPQWSSSPCNMLLSTLLIGIPNKEGQPQSPQRPVPSDVVTDFVERYLQEYDDVRFAFCRRMAEMLQGNAEMPTASLTTTRRQAIDVMLGITAIPTEAEHLNTFLVPGMAQEGRRKKKKGKGTAEEGEQDDGEEALEDWFSDSDEEGASTAALPKAGSRRAAKANIEGLGAAARSADASASARRRLRSRPTFFLAVNSLTTQRAAFARAWLSLLLPTQDGKVRIGGAMATAQVHETLVRMHAQVLPHLPKPTLLHDFLVDALDAGGATALLALNALFTLITKHNLNYPAFYSRLYALLLDDPPFLHVRFRSRFLRLLDTFLASTHLPATLIASFAKRLARAALRAPPAAIVVILPFVWNLCKRHKRCLNLIHRDFGDDRFDQGPAGLADPYDALETDPLKTNAIDSSLWELAAMGSTLGVSHQITGGTAHSEGQAHYLATVSTLSKILAEPFTKERYGLEDFLDLTYGTMFETETNKTLRRREGKRVTEPAVAFDLPRDGQGKRTWTFAVEGETEAVQGKRVKLVEGEEGEEEQEQEQVADQQPNEDDDDEVREARQAIREARAAEGGSIANQLFRF